MTIKTTFTLTKAKGEDLFSRSPALPKRTLLRRFANELLALAGGVGGGTGSERTTIRFGTATGSGTVTCAAVQNADTVTINGTALTATQHYARGTITPTVTGIDVDDTLLINATTLTAKRHNATGTVTMTVSGIDVDDTVTINGYAFTAKASETLGSGFFNIGGTDAQAATSLAACINASVNVLITGIVTATATSNVCTVRAVATGIAGNSITLASSDAQAAVSGANLANAVAVTADTFDITGTDAQCCTSILAAINASVALQAILTAATTSTVVTMRLKTAGTAGNSTVLTSSDAQLAVSGSGTFTGGAAVGNNQFDFGGTNAQTATALAAAINASTTDLISDAVDASATNAIVTLTADFEGVSGNEVTLASSDAGRLLTSGARLSGGTETTYTF